jgi:hypothetical protein
MLAEHIHRNDPRAVIVMISLGRLEVQPRPRLNSEETSQADRINRSVIILASMKLHRVSVHKNEALVLGSWGLGVLGSWGDTSAKTDDLSARWRT